MSEIQQSLLNAEKHRFLEWSYLDIATWFFPSYWKISNLISLSQWALAWRKIYLKAENGIL